MYTNVCVCTIYIYIYSYIYYVLCMIYIVYMIYKLCIKGDTVQHAMYDIHMLYARYT